MGTRLLDVKNFPVFERPDEVCRDPSSAQFHTFLRQMQRDEGVISDREMAIIEVAAGSMASRNEVMFNPFTGEFHREGGGW